MKRKKVFRLATLIAVVVVVALLSAGLATVEAADKVYRMKIQSLYPHGDLGFENLKVFADSAAKRSNGRLKISVFAEPDLVPWDQLYDATKKGALDMNLAIGGLYVGAIPVGEVEFSLPYGYDIPGTKSYAESAEILRKFFYESGMVDLLRKEYAKHGLYWLDMQYWGQNFVMSKKPIKAWNDWKGVKIRSEGIWTAYWDSLGARGTELSAAEAYMGLKLGTIDAAQWDVNAVTGMKWNEVAPYRIIGAGVSASVGNFVVNLKKWNSLPDDLKEAIRGAAEDYYNAIVEIYTGEYEKVAELTRKGKVIESWTNDDCNKKAYEAAQKLWDEIAQRDVASAEAIQLIRAWRKTLK